MRKLLLLCSAIVPFAAPIAAFPEIVMADEALDELLAMPVEGLLNVEVTSVSKKSEKISEASAAVFVINQEDIKRSGHRSVPELLRMVPGVQVAKIDSNKWAISARGLNNQFATKLLVLVDGRSVYSPVFAGVFWDEQDVMLEDIERIEVIRGPGATLWGANAVNGVINIITKNSKDTQGGIATVGAGSYDEAFGSFRYGGKTASNSYYRAYGKADSYDDNYLINGSDGHDGRKNGKVGFRTDSNLSEQDTLTVQGDVQRQNMDQRYILPLLSAPYNRVVDGNVQTRAANLLARWTRNLSEDSDLTVQGYVDNSQREYFIYDQNVTTMDVDMQHSFNLNDRNQFIWGTGYRHVDFNTRSTEFITFDADTATDDTLSAFLQNRTEVFTDALYLTLGSKFEKNTYTDFESQPNARLTWNINDKNTAWASVARAIRVPSRSTGANLMVEAFPPNTIRPGTPNGTANLILDREARAEKLIAYEAGYRADITKKVSLDIATFYNEYDDQYLPMRANPFLSSLRPPRLTVPFNYQNNLKGYTYGVEIAPNWQVTDKWQLSAGYSFLEMQFTPKNGDKTTFADEDVEGSSPEHQLNIRSYYDVTDNVTLDAAVYYTDELPYQNIKDKLRVDTRVAWKPKQDIELSIAGQNLLDDKSPEFTGSIFSPDQQVGRSVYGQVSWKF